MPNPYNQIVKMKINSILSTDTGIRSRNTCIQDTPLLCCVENDLRQEIANPCSDFRKSLFGFLKNPKGIFKKTPHKSKKHFLVLFSALNAKHS
jgi:hypothetical protein